jgi:hypothetical protein
MPYAPSVVAVLIIGNGTAEATGRYMALRIRVSFFDRPPHINEHRHSWYTLPIIVERSSRW